MDSLIHYDTPDIVKAVHGLSLRTRRAILFTFAPRTPLLAVMHSVGRLFPRSDRSPALAPVSAVDLNLGLETVLQGTTWQAGRSQRISSGFYTSQAWEWRQA
jgi:magnesium-protoporphyrin O-methyltransferase